MPHDIVDKFSTHLKNVLTRALCFAVENHQPHIEPEHLLWALLQEKGSIAAYVLQKGHVKLKEVETWIAREPVNSTSTPQLSAQARRALEKAVLAASVWEHRHVGTEHLLCGLLQAKSESLHAFFAHHHINLTDVGNHVAALLKSTTHFPELAEHMAYDEQETETPDDVLSILAEKDPPDDKKTPALDFFGVDLTGKESQTRIDPVIGREQEIERVMEILCRRTKNNPLLIGEPGVGKTAIVEGLAKRIAQKQVPIPLLGKRIVALDLPLIVAGTMYRGEFEGRLRQIIDEAKGNENLILFIDELHVIVGAGSSSGALDAANILKPSLARGEIRCIGATTLAEYKKHVEPDAALERRFQTVLVEEPSVQKALEILQGVVEFYESFHGVRVAPEALEAAVALSARYMQDKKLPDKALDLLDEAAARARVRAIEPGPVERRRLLEQTLEDVRSQKRTAVAEERFEDATTLKQEQERLERQLLIKRTASPAPSLTITAADIRQVVARTTGIPEENIATEHGHALQTLERDLSTHVIGQDRAIAMVAGALRRAKSGVAHPNRPLLSLLFLGPSGVGKTELAKAVARLAFGGEKNLIRLDMSEFAEPHAISKLVGAPAGYVGYREAAKLTDQVKQKPYSVVLFDELEKAHRDVQNILLQILEEGEATDATGRKINFKNTAVIITSNVGLETFYGGGIGFASAPTTFTTLSTDMRTQLEERFRPELLNRVDHLCLFDPLTEDGLKHIAEKQLHELVERLKQQTVHLDIHPSAPMHIAKLADRKLGARDIRRLIQTHVETPAAEKLLKHRNARLALELVSGALHLRAKRPV